MVNRRVFLQGTASFGAVVGLPVVASGADKGKLMMKIGVISDLHIAPRNNVLLFKKALRAFDKWGADGILACGDLTDFGTSKELELVAKAWFDVFPENRRSDGAAVVNLLHYGDHDCSGGTYRGSGECVRAYPDEAAMKRLIIPFNDRKAIWERCFREDWMPIVHKNVKGYDFILSHFSKGEPGNYHGNNVPGLDKFMARIDIDHTRPFFYSQHRVLRNTAGGPLVWGQDDGNVRSLLSSRYPNCIAFCGHKHLTAAEEMAIWQGEFTVVAVPSLSYCVTLAGRENGYSLNDKPCDRASYMMRGLHHGGQGLFVSVYENAIDVKRWSFTFDGQLGPDWSIPLPLPNDRYSHDRRTVSDPVPEFAVGAELKVSLSNGTDRAGRKRDFAEVSFPAVKGSGEIPRANDYEVQLEVGCEYVEKVIDTRRVFSPGYVGAYEKDTGPVVCRFPVEDIPVGRTVRFTASPVNSFSRKGGKIASGWFRYDGVKFVESAHP